MPQLDLHKKPFGDTTITKLEIFEKYLEEWLPVFIHSSCKSVNICDFFAGTGKDINNVPGSPMRILNIVDKYADQILQKGLHIKIILNEYDNNKFEKLKLCTQKRLKGIPSLHNMLNIQHVNKDFKILFKEMTEELRDQRNLIFIDQSGVKFVTENIFLALDEFTKTDFIFFISSSSFKRFSDGFKEYHPKMKIDFSNTKYAETHNQILEYFRGLLPNSSKTKLYPFTLKNGANIYGLIFGTKHPLGVEKFLNIAWQTNKINGVANFDIDDDKRKGQLSWLEDIKLTKLDQFKIDLENFARSKKEFTNKDVLEYTLESGFSVKEAAKNLKEMRDNKTLEHFSYPLISCKNVLNDKKIIKFKVQKE